MFTNDYCNKHVFVYKGGVLMLVAVYWWDIDVEL